MGEWNVSMAFSGVEEAVTPKMLGAIKLTWKASISKGTTKQTHYYFDGTELT